MCVLSAVVLVSLPRTGEATLVVAFDDPATPGIDYRIEDNGPGDLDDTGIEGLIVIGITEGPLTVFGGAVSKPRVGSAESPELILNIRTLRYSVGELVISVTDTDFEVTDPSQGEGSVLGLSMATGESITFDFYGDTNNQEFAKGFDIVTSQPYFPRLLYENIRGLNGPADPVGSLTMSAYVNQPADGPESIDLEYNQHVQLVTGNEPPPPTEPDASFTYSPTNPAVGQAVQFTDTSTGGRIETWAWDFDDGDSSSEQNPVHVFTEAGSYGVELEVVNDGGRDDERVTVEVTDVLGEPVASFTYLPSDPFLGEAVRFRDTSTGGAADTRMWDCGDGATSTDPNPAHLYADVGSYSVRLTLSNDAGTSEAVETVEVAGGTRLDAATFIAAASLAAGAEGSFFQTDVDIANGAGVLATYRFVWLPRGADNSDPVFSDPFTLAAGSSARYENVLSEVFGLSADVNGALAVYSDTTGLAVMSRTYNLPQAKVSGTFGQAIAGVPSQDLLTTGDVGRIIFLSEDPDFRANLGCVNGFPESLRILIDLYDADGALLETKTMDLPPLSNNQLNRIFGDYAPINGYADVRTNKEGAGYTCYGSVLDNGSSGPTTITPVLQ